jgi:putative ABC transport system substrate-binding protein
MKGEPMRRREFIAGLGAVAWPLAARAQQSGGVRRIGVLMNLAEDDPESLRRVAAFVQGLEELGWTDGRNVRIDYRSGLADADRYRRYAAELVALAPDIVLTSGASVAVPLLQVSRTVPIVFVQTTDPVGAGLVASLARPGGNTTGFTSSKYSVSGKWLQLLKQIAPSVTRVAVLRTSDTPTGPAEFGIIQATAQSLRVEVNPVNIRDVGEIERAVATFARSANGGLIVTGSALAVVHRDLIVTLAARHKLPAVYYQRAFVAAGGLISYGSSHLDNCRRVAGYVDRILKGERPADLPVQAPVKYETVLNLQAAKALGLTIPETLLATADEVIQ